MAISETMKGKESALARHLAAGGLVNFEHGTILVVGNASAVSVFFSLDRKVKD